MISIEYWKLLGKSLLFVFILTFFTNWVCAQNDTLIHKPRFNSIQKTTLYSAILPGLGQINNKKYWKLPIIYGLLGYTAYNVVQSNTSYLLFKDAYTNKINNTLPTPDPYSGFSTASLKANRDYNRKNRDLFILFTFVIWGLNVVDAHVDAHLQQFNINDNLSLSLDPQLQSSFGQNSTSLVSLKLKLK